VFRFVSLYFFKVKQVFLTVSVLINFLLVRERERESELERCEDRHVPFCIKCLNSQTYLIKCKYNFKCMMMMKKKKKN
jgi:hypothetical protein